MYYFEAVIDFVRMDVMMNCAFRMLQDEFRKKKKPFGI